VMSQHSAAVRSVVYSPEHGMNAPRPSLDQAMNLTPPFSQTSSSLPPGTRPSTFTPPTPPTNLSRSPSPASPTPSPSPPPSSSSA